METDHTLAPLCMEGDDQCDEDPRGCGVANVVPTPSGSHAAPLQGAPPTSSQGPGRSVDRGGRLKTTAGDDVPETAPDESGSLTLTGTGLSGKRKGASLLHVTGTRTRKR